MNHSILCLDDEVDIVDSLERLFRRTYQVFKATSADQGLEILRREHVSLIISDQRMPGMTGVEFLKESKKYCPEAIRILLTGYTDIDSAVDSINKGEVYRYLTKPWDPADLVNTVHKAIERYELAEELKRKNLELSEALEELKSLDKAKTEFMLLMNHELRTPLTVILSFLELLKESSPSLEQKTFLSRIEESSQRLMLLIQDSLELLAAETGQIRLKRQSIALDDVVKSVLTEYQTKFKDRQLAVNLDHLSGNKVHADPEILRKVLRRVFDNIVRFAFDHSTVSFRSEVLADQRVLVTFENEGKPIPKEIIKRILEPFTLNEDALHHSQGNGLGLSICRALLKTMGSQIHIKSIKSKFSLQFDLALSEA